MKIIRLNSKLDEKGYYPIPKNLTNRMMFCYPNLGEDDKWGTKERDNKKINAIVSYFGEFFKNKNLSWHIGMMGYENMIIFDSNDKEYDCYFGLFVYSGGRFLYKLKNYDDWYTYNKNIVQLQRMEKIDKIIKR